MNCQVIGCISASGGAEIMATVSEDVSITEPSEAEGHGNAAAEKNEVVGTQIVHARPFCPLCLAMYLEVREQYMKVTGQVKI